jgi:glycosyltransferase involved in cell wall biosynthesis
LHLIVEILKNFKEDVVWTHFGSGPLEEEIAMQAKSLANNVSINFKGLVDNKDIMNFYLNTHVDFFINVSEIEGIPVSLMEAISFGIPVLGCNICGVPEIVNFRTGYLLDKDFNPKDVAKIIKDHNSKSLEQKIEFTKNVKSFWLEKFNAKKNYVDFIENKLKNY